MRSILIAALFAATAISPAMAQDGDSGAREQAMRERLGGFARHLPRQNGGEDARAERAQERVQQPVQPAPQAAPPSVMRGESSERRGGGGGWNRGEDRGGGGWNRSENRVENRGGMRAENHGGRHADRDQHRNGNWNTNDGWRNRGDYGRRDSDRREEARRDDAHRDRHDGARHHDNRDSGRRWNNQRYGHVDNHHNSQRHSWNHNWRKNNRYDWYGHRSRYNDYYRMPRYSNPFGYGYGYRSFGIGSRLDGLFFSSRYWIRDPFSYRLPEPGYGYRWVRYYNDVLLVDMREGEVVDVIRNFFW